ncbi:hypothetical protein B0H14DRAFT_2612656 [Mycena olivaceomarginata]|nr:hypothetical protein B0H14DRAFT_2612656 [Mycena olivaceomarginata]
MCRHSLPLSAWITMGLVHLHGTSTFNSVDVLIRCQLLVATQGQHDTPIPVYLVAAGHGEIFRPCRVAFALYFPEVHSLPSSAWITMRLVHLHGRHSVDVLICCQLSVLLRDNTIHQSQCTLWLRVIADVSAMLCCFCFPEFHNIMVLFDLPTVRCLFLRFILGYWEHLSMGSRGYTELQANTVNTVEYGQIQSNTAKYGRIRANTGHYVDRAEIRVNTYSGHQIQIQKYVGLRRGSKSFCMLESLDNIHGDFVVAVRRAVWLC